MHRNLRAEMAREGITMVDIADYLNLRYATVNEKVNGKYRFYYDEALKIKKRFFPNQSLEYLFENDAQYEKSRGRLNTHDLTSSG
jgi:plasmid maintenance system antidote protein VapI